MHEPLLWLLAVLYGTLVTIWLGFEEDGFPAGWVLVLFGEKFHGLPVAFVLILILDRVKPGPKMLIVL